MASVRFICGTNNLHRELENKLSTFLGFEDTILYVACFDANGGLFEPLFTKEDAINAKASMGTPPDGIKRNSDKSKMSLLRRKVAERLVSAKNETAMLTTFNEAN